MSHRDVAGWPPGLTDPDAWEYFNERAAIAEFDGGFARQDAEVFALNLTQMRVARQLT